MKSIIIYHATTHSKCANSIKLASYNGDILKLEINAKRVIEKEVKPHGRNSAGRIYLPESWIGAKVIIIEEAKEK